ncbi:LysR family transcriptional regulator [Uliginosibacterium sp. 31-16]|uniref:LysR family transcriptional regulator n=1 Tax=Uliginosibacterium sp. 31-16 TaxID=3068315 RepID=UPI00273D10C4|nr:LysR family transcriptional regulator [Uliginosibacterium sp. 31-16]MDP5238298.1 LysR family transcriptional regulator [Uliginosibacterium sp. 31-16]
MANVCNWDSIDVHLLRVLHMLLTECSVSRAARRLNQSQPAISTALRRLRELTGDPLLVRSKNGMTPTERGVALLEPVKQALANIENIVIGQPRFEPASSRRVFNVATPDYLAPALLGRILARFHSLAPHAQIIFHSFSPEQDFAGLLADGTLDVVIGNWPHPPEQLRLSPLFDDEVVCMMREDHPLAGRPLTMKNYLDAEHLAPTPYAVGQRGVVDLHLARERLKRDVVAWVPYFSLAPYMLMESNMLFTCPRAFAEHFARLLPVALARSPIEYPPMSFYLLWHDRAHYAEDCRWFREQIVAVARASGAQNARPMPSTPTDFRMPAFVS